MFLHLLLFLLHNGHNLFHYLFLNPLFYFHESASGGCIFAALVGYTVSVSSLFLLFTVYVLYTADLNEAQ